MDNLSCNLTAADGSSLRFGPDEALAINVPVSIEFGTALSWGFAEAMVTLKRPAGQSDLDKFLFANATIFDDAGQTVYKGRVAGVPRGGQTEVSLDLEGPLAHLDDNASARRRHQMNQNHGRPCGSCAVARVAGQTAEAGKDAERDHLV